MASPWVGFLRPKQVEELSYELTICPADKLKRVPVISWKVQGRSSREIVEAIDKKSNYGCRWGGFYSNRLIEDVLGLDPNDGIVRLSALHYNTGMCQETRESV